MKDAKDDFILELAVESVSDYIVTFNKQDFKNVERFGIGALIPQEFLNIIGEVS